LGNRANRRLRHVVVFFALAFGVTWSAWLTWAWLEGSLRWLVFYVGVFAPALVALWLTWREGGGRNVGLLLARLFRWRVAARWYAFAIGYLAWPGSRSACCGSRRVSSCGGSRSGSLCLGLRRGWGRQLVRSQQANAPFVARAHHHPGDREATQNRGRRIIRASAPDLDLTVNGDDTGRDEPDLAHARCVTEVGPLAPELLAEMPVNGRTRLQ
jgi:hypothetical protein